MAARCSRKSATGRRGMFEIKDDDLKLCSCCNWEVAPEILHWHHDHMGDYPKQLFRKELGSEWQATLRERHQNVSFFIEGLRRFVIRFEFEQICRNCNEADPNAKRIIGAHPTLFSFSPAEIRAISDHSDTFAIPWPIQTEMASKLWLAQKPYFERRLRFVEKTVEAILKGDFWMAPRYSHEVEKIADWARG